MLEWKMNPLINIIAGYYESHGKNKEALKIREKMVAADPSSTTNRMRLAELYQNEGEAENSLKHYETAASTILGNKSKTGLIEVYEKIVASAQDAHSPTWSIGSLMVMSYGRPLGDNTMNFPYLRTPDGEIIPEKVRLRINEEPGDIGWEEANIFPYAFGYLERDGGKEIEAEKVLIYMPNLDAWKKSAFFRTSFTTCISSIVAVKAAGSR